MRFRALATLVASFLLALPAAALAQSAGDEQYTDPFGQQTPPPSSPDNSGDEGDSGNDDLAPTQSPSSDNGNGNGTVGGNSGASPSTSTTASSADSALPRTGLRTWMLAVMGGTMLLFGALLRLGARPRRLR